MCVYCGISIVLLYVFESCLSGYGRGAQLKGGGPTYYSGHFFPENCMKLKKNGPRGTGRVSLALPIDPTPKELKPRWCGKRPDLSDPPGQISFFVSAARSQTYLVTLTARLDWIPGL